MLSKVLKRGFGTFNIINSINNFKKALTAPIKHLKAFNQPSGVNYSTQTNTTSEAFDEVSHEWQTYVAGNPFDLQTFNFLQNAQLMNFGTVDNPLVIFTADAPFRYVGCTGPQNEDDYQGHQLMWIMLREGPLQRCGICGQVFKLVRLRDQRSAEMNYYIPNFHQFEEQQMGEHDIIALLSLQKMTTHYEYTHHQTPQDSVYSLINPDQHDRILVDPAYRMQRLTLVQQRAKFIDHVVNKIEQQNQKKSKFREPISKMDYENLIQVEAAIKKLDRQFRKVVKFQSRKYMDKDNHERRQKRMLERANQRWQGAYTLYTGNLTQQQQKYRDYFETDLQNYPEDQRVEQFLDKQQLLNEPRYNLNRYDFQQNYIVATEDDQSSYLQKKIFKFKYRQALDSKQDYDRRNSRLIDRQRQRFLKNNYQQIIDNYLTDPLENQQSYIQFVQKQSVLLYKDYFESQNDQYVDLLAKSSPNSFVPVFQNYQLQKHDRSSFITVKQTEWNPALGWWANTLNQWSDVLKIVPTAQAYTNQSLLRQRGSVLAEGINTKKDLVQNQAIEDFESPKPLEIEKK